MRSFRLLAISALIAAAASLAPAQTVINSVPYTITASGKYVLGNNVATSAPFSAGAAIVINAPNVVLDLNGFFVSGPGNDVGSTAQAIAVGDVSNVTIRNGTVANYGYGILISQGVRTFNHLVEGVVATRCYIGGIWFSPASDASAGSIVRGCAVTQIGGSPVNPTAAGISAARGVRVENNTVAGAIFNGASTRYGIFAADGAFLLGNTVSSCQVGISGGKYLNNLTFDCALPFQGGVNAVGNN